ncbi:MAG: hypothetical protein HZB49_06580 [Bradyrhizobium sp.]|nr:hypothetical protein [Bradyrhizobium sp.]
MSSVQFRDVHKSSGSREMLHGASIPIEDDEFVVPVNPTADILALSQRQNLDGVCGHR